MPATRRARSADYAAGGVRGSCPGTGARGTPQLKRLPGSGATYPSRSAPQEPREDQTSSFVRTRSTTAVVNSVVPALPPRSGVLTPEASVSSADS